MRYYKFPLANGTIVQTCAAGLGYGFAAGTTDYPGPLGFTQANNDSNSQNPFWAAVSGVLSTPSPELVAVRYPSTGICSNFKLTDDTSVSIAQAGSPQRR